jgi:anti-anti-sigma factor
MTTTPPQVPPPGLLRIEVSFPSPGTARLAVAGELDLATAPVLGMRILTVMAGHYPTDVDVDLAEVTFLDCSAISMLVAARNTAEQNRRQIRISYPQPFVALVLEVAGVLTVFTTPVAPVAPVVPPRSASSVTARARVARMARAMVGRAAA